MIGGLATTSAILEIDGVYAFLLGQPMGTLYRRSRLFPLLMQSTVCDAVADKHNICALLSKAK
jgi:hypothetical protein